MSSGCPTSLHRLLKCTQALTTDLAANIGSLDMLCLLVSRQRCPRVWAWPAGELAQPRARKQCTGCLPHLAQLAKCECELSLPGLRFLVRNWESVPPQYGDAQGLLLEYVCTHPSECAGRGPLRW